MQSLPNVVVVGSINVDLTAIAERLPTAGETIGAGTLHRDAGGKGANQAAAASKLGANVRMIGAVGDDGDGAWMLSELAAAGVGTTDIATVNGATGTALIAVDRHGENQIVVCPGANTAVELPESRIEADLVLTQLELDIELVVELSRRTEAFLVVNAAPAQPLPQELLERTDLFIVNESEYALMPELRTARRVAVTYGGDGAAFVENGTETVRVPAQRAEAVNTVGAGDSFCAALALALAAGMTDEQALRTACAVGAAAVTFAGSQPPFERLDTYAPTSTSSPRA